MRPQVLIVDDDEVIVFLHELIIRESGLSAAPLSFRNGRLALNYLNSHHEAAEHYLIFLDLNMPIMNGWELVNAIQASCYQHQVSVVMVTSSINYSDRIKANLYPLIIEYAEKPLTFKICERLKSMLNIGR